MKRPNPVRSRFATHRDLVVRRDDPVSEVAKKILSIHYRRMVASEKGTRKGEDIEKLHDMRVAVRRMRTAARVFGRFLDEDEFGPFARELRTLGRELGPVRDLDVMMDHARRFRESVRMRERIDMDGLLGDWQKERARLRRRLLIHMDTSAYQRLKEDFPRFLDDPSAGARPVITKSGRVRPALLSHVGPVILLEHLAAVRAYEGWLDGEEVPLRRYHRLRIEVKRLRYALEFLSDVAGPEAEPLIASLRAVQDHLGEMREAWMTADRLEREFLPHASEGPEPTRHPGITAYLVSRRNRCEELRAAFPAMWTTISNREVYRRIAAIAASL